MVSKNLIQRIKEAKPLKGAFRKAGLFFLGGLALLSYLATPLRAVDLIGDVQLSADGFKPDGGKATFYNLSEPDTQHFIIDYDETTNNYFYGFFNGNDGDTVLVTVEKDSINGTDTLHYSNSLKLVLNDSSYIKCTGAPDIALDVPDNEKQAILVDMWEVLPDTTVDTAWVYPESAKAELYFKNYPDDRLYDSINIYHDVDELGCHIHFNLENLDSVWIKDDKTPIGDTALLSIKQNYDGNIYEASDTFEIDTSFAGSLDNFYSWVHGDYWYGYHQSIFMPGPGGYGKIIVLPNLMLQKNGPIGIKEKDLENKLENLNAFPNPFTNKVSFYKDKDKSKAKAETYEIYDMTGRLVRNLNDAVWDGTDNKGKELPSGVYFLKLQGNVGKVYQSKIIKF